MIRYKCNCGAELEIRESRRKETLESLEEYTERLKWVDIRIQAFREDHQGCLEFEEEEVRHEESNSISQPYVTMEQLAVEMVYRLHNGAISLQVGYELLTNLRATHKGTRIIVTDCEYKVA